MALDERDLSLQTEVKNTSGVDMSFSYLPPHGKRLKAGQAFIFDGDLFHYFAHNRRKIKAFKGDLKAGRLALIRTPSPHYWDEPADQMRVLQISGGVVSGTAPSWGSYSSAEQVDND